MVVNMKGLKKCGLLFLFFTIFGLSLNVCLDTNALKHEYDGLLYNGYSIPCPSYDSSSNKKYFDWSNSNCESNSGYPLVLEFEGDAYQSAYSSLSPKFSSSYLNTQFNSSSHPDSTQCYYTDVHPIFNFDERYHGGFATRLGLRFHSNYVVPFPSYVACQKADLQFNSTNFDMDSIPPGLLSCSRSNGAICDGLWNTREYIDNQIFPFAFSSNGFYLKSHTVDVDGIHYNNTFSFNDMLNNYIPTFSLLSIPLQTTGDYFINPSNLYSGRQFEFDFHFEFDGSFSWHDNIDNNGSFIKLSFSTYSLYGSNDNWSEYSYDCPANLITLDGFTRLDITCNFNLENDFLALYGLHLDISGNGNYVWITDKEWRFTDVFVVTDGDETPGDSFNTSLSGGGSIPGDAANQISSGTPDWFASLTNLFGFSFFNPFAGIFNLFSDSSSCASIPTIAGMIHSEETTICPWFDSNTRSILTPVLGMSSVMLVFGFAVRWLGSSSGNLFEDSGGVDTDNYHFGNKFRRHK